MGTTAEGQHDGIQPDAGPENKFDGIVADPDTDGYGTSADPFPGKLRITQPWKTGQGAPEASGFSLGRIPA